MAVSPQNFIPIITFCRQNDMRIGQFLQNVFGEVETDNEGLHTQHIPDMFHMSDEEFDSAVSSYIRRVTGD